MHHLSRRTGEPRRACNDTAVNNAYVAAPLTLCGCLHRSIRAKMGERTWRRSCQPGARAHKCGRTWSRKDVLPSAVCTLRACTPMTWTWGQTNTLTQLGLRQSIHGTERASRARHRRGQAFGRAHEPARAIQRTCAAAGAESASGACDRINNAADRVLNHMAVGKPARCSGRSCLPCMAVEHPGGLSGKRKPRCKASVARCRLGKSYRLCLKNTV